MAERKTVDGKTYELVETEERFCNGCAAWPRDGVFDRDMCVKLDCGAVCGRQWREVTNTNGVNETLVNALRPFARFVFGPLWAGHTEIERGGDCCVMCGYGEDGKETGVNVNFSDFVRARTALLAAGVKVEGEVPNG